MHRNSYIILAVLIFLSVSCKKHTINLQANNPEAGSNDLLEVVPAALNGSENRITEIVKLTSVNEQGLLFLARHQNRYLYGKLAKNGHFVDYLRELDFVPTDIIRYADSDGYSFRFLIAGSKNNRGILNAYVVETGQLENTIVFPSIESINAVIVTRREKYYYCVGNPVSSARIYKLSDHFTDFIQVTDSFIVSNQALNITHMAELKSDSTFLIYYDSANRKIPAIYDIHKKVKSTVRETGLPYTAVNTSDDVILKSYTDKVLMSNLPKQPVPVPLSYSKLTSVGNFPTEDSWWNLNTVALESEILNNYKVYDIIKSGNNIYVCGVCYNNRFDGLHNLAGFAFIVKDNINSPGNAVWYTFGDRKNLSVFKTMEISGEYLYASGFKDEYFTNDNPVTWYTGSHVRPFFAKIQLSKL